MSHVTWGDCRVYVVASSLGVDWCVKSMRNVIGFLYLIFLVTVWSVAWVQVDISRCKCKLWVVLYVDELIAAYERLTRFIGSLVFLHGYWLLTCTCIVNILAYFENIRYPWGTLLDEGWVWYDFICLYIFYAICILSVCIISCCVHCHQPSIDRSLPVCIHGRPRPRTTCFDSFHRLLTEQG